jgi:hypothetical protein
MKSQKTLLNTLLQAVVDEWGREEVVNSLALITRPYPIDIDSNSHASRRKVKLSAVEQVRRVPLTGDRKELLLRLAERYDFKQFLPSVADVREFLIMMGEKPLGMKDRKGAFTILLRTLTKLPVEALQQINGNAMYSGPSELGPLSDAIAAAGARLNRPT